MLELVGAIKQGEETVGASSNWRIHSEMLRQIAALALCLLPDLLFAEVVPLMIHRMHTVVSEGRQLSPSNHSSAALEGLKG